MTDTSREIRPPTSNTLAKPPGSAKTFFKIPNLRGDIVPGAESDVPEMDFTSRKADGIKVGLASVLPKLKAPAPAPAARRPAPRPELEVMPGKPMRIKQNAPGVVRFHPQVRRNSVLSKTVPNAAARAAAVGKVRQEPEAPAASNVVIQLGRYGDIMSILPALMGREDRKTLMVSRDFQDILDGVGYVDRLVFEGGHGQLKQAEVRAPRGSQTAQVWGENFAWPKRENYQRDSWERIGMARRWEQMGLVFDRRDPIREFELANRVLELGKVRRQPAKPFVLVNVSSHSSPFPKGPQLLAELQKELADQFEVIDISNVKAHRIYDMLGLYDRANLLVSVDSAPLHLAQASSIPVCALVNDKRWEASLRRTNHVVYRPYRDVSVIEIAEAARRTLPVSSVSKIVHVYSEYDMKPDDRRRADLAMASWAMERNVDGNYILRPVGYKTDPEMRTSDKELGDSRSVPYVRDMIQKGLETATSEGDIILLTNSDVGFTRGFTGDLRRQCSTFGACFGYRFDFPKLGQEALSFDKVDTMHGGWHGGLDVFAFTAGWLVKHGDKLPDCVLGSRDWDIVYRDILRYLRGGELVASHWHETHNSDWIVAGDSSPTNAHNAGILREWRKDHDTTRPFSL